jgi:3-methyladenine DNA glycosylase AlkC
MGDEFLMKDRLGEIAVNHIVQHLQLVIPQFKTAQFKRDALSGLNDLELKARVTHLIHVLHRYYPSDFRVLCTSMKKLAQNWQQTKNDDPRTYFAAWPIIDYFSIYGLEEPEASLQVLEELTSLFSAEFAVRPFILQHPELSYGYIVKWTQHPNEHVRRLASEGSRPRLPWGMALLHYKKNPEALAAILEPLKADSSLYVRKSVANNLNDITKDNPEWVIALCKRWKKDKHEHTDWIINRALRSLVKTGDARVFPLLGYTDKTDVAISDLKIKKSKIKVGDTLEFSFTLSAGKKDQELVVDYVVYFQKANGSLSPKVFKLKNLTLKAKEELSLTKKQSFKLITTRQYYAGLHQLAIQVNGQELARKDFYLS